MIQNVSFLLLTIKIVLLVNTGVKSEECSVLRTLTERLDSLETNLKTELYEAKEILDRMEKRSLNQDKNFKRELFGIKDEILAEIEKVLPYSQRTSFKNDLKRNVDKVSTDAPLDCKDWCDTRMELEPELESEIRSNFTILAERLNSVETHLKKALNEAKNEIIGEIKKLTLIQNRNFEREPVKVEKETATMLSSTQPTNEKNELKINKAEEEITTETAIVLSNTQPTSVINELKINNDQVTTEIKIYETLPSDCKEVQERGFKSSGTYTIQPKLANEPFSVWCDMKTEKGGWTYLLNRIDGSQDFNLNWAEYKQGFGNLSGEHWLGLEHIYELTNSKLYQLFIELVDWESTKAQAFYSNFRIGDESESYSLNSVGKFRGNTGDALTRHRGVKFSTPDRDNDNNPDEESCSVYFKSGWWFNDCFFTLLTGQYIYNPLPVGDYYYQSAIKWETFHGFNYSLKEARMMIKPI